MLTVNNNGMLNDAETFVNECVDTYKKYLTELFTTKPVDELTRNELAFVRLVSNSSIKSMSEKKTNLEILNSPVAKPSVARATPLTEDVVSAFLAKLSPEKRKQLLGL